MNDWKLADEDPDGSHGLSTILPCHKKIGCNSISFCNSTPIHLIEMKLKELESILQDCEVFGMIQVHHV